MSWPNQTSARPWDDGITWRTVETARDDRFLAIKAEFYRTHVLRASVDEVADELLQQEIKAATEMGERISGAHITPKTLQLLLSGFPASGRIEFADAPVIAIDSVAYIDGDGAEQDYGAGSPPGWTFIPAGRFGRAVLQTGSSGAWPSAYTRPDAVTVTFRVGYETAAEVPFGIRQAIAVTAGELHKSPDLSNADGLAPNVLKLEHFWPRRWSNG